MHFVGLSPNGPHPNAPGDPSTPRFNGSQVQSSSFFNSKFKFLLMRESNIHVTGFSNGEGLPQPGRLRRGRHRFQVDTGHHCLQPGIQARVSTLLPYLWARDTGRRHGQLQLEGKPRRGECHRGRHQCRSDLLLHR
jgi:hypothetical protein